MFMQQFQFDIILQTQKKEAKKIENTIKIKEKYHQFVKKKEMRQHKQLQ